MAKTTFDPELIHQNESHRRSGGDPDRPDQEGVHDFQPGQDIKGGGDGEPGDTGLDEADDESRVSDPPDPADMEFLADTESHHAQKDKDEKMKSVQGVVIETAGGAGENTRQVEGVRSDQGPADELSGDFRKPQADEKFSPEMGGQDDQSQGHHLDGNLSAGQGSGCAGNGFGH